MANAVKENAQKPRKNSTGSVYSRHGVIYSYGEHYPLAIFAGGKVFVNATKYSTTTTRHKYHLKNALSQNGILYSEITIQDMFTALKTYTR